MPDSSTGGSALCFPLLLVLRCGRAESGALATRARSGGAALRGEVRAPRPAEVALRLSGGGGC